MEITSSNVVKGLLSIRPDALSAQEPAATRVDFVEKSETPKLSLEERCACISHVSRYAGGRSGT